MLIYHPVYDLNHALYRSLRILETSDHTEMQLDLFRIVDFYSIFPHLLKHISPFPNTLKKYKKNVMSIPSPYERIGNVKRVMFELESIQTTALQNLLAKGFIDVESYRNKKIKRSRLELPPKLLQAIAEDTIPEESWFLMLVNEFCDVKIKGKSGLKSKTGLMEFRYDMEKK